MVEVGCCGMLNAAWIIYFPYYPSYFVEVVE
jgi:hypothetical protein